MRLNLGIDMLLRYLAVRLVENQLLGVSIQVEQAVGREPPPPPLVMPYLAVNVRELVDTHPLLERVVLAGLTVAMSARLSVPLAFLPKFVKERGNGSLIDPTLGVAIVGKLVFGHQATSVGISR